MAYGQPEPGGGWRSRYKRPDGTLGSKSGFTSEKAAEDWGNEQEALIRRNMWIDPRDAETLFGDFVEEWLSAVSPRLEPGTVAKYRSVLNTHLLPQWERWPMIGIFNSYVEIEKWVSELHEDYADPTIATIFATFSTVLNVAVRARLIPANPCFGIRVTSGEFATERLVASPVQVLRAAMRLYEPLGRGGFTIQQPLKEVGGRVFKGGRRIDLDEGSPAEQPVGGSSRRPRRAKKGRTKTPAGTRQVQLPVSVAVLYEELLDSHRHPFVFCTPEGGPWRRSNFRQRYWRPAWDGHNPANPCADDHTPSILPWFTFHEGRHTHST